MNEGSCRAKCLSESADGLTSAPAFPSTLKSSPSPVARRDVFNVGDNVDEDLITVDSERSSKPPEERGPVVRLSSTPTPEVRESFPSLWVVLPT